MNIKRVKFFLSHVANVAIVSGVAWIIYSIFGVFGVCTFAGYAWLRGKEFGEIVGRLKVKASFSNTLRGNIDAFKQSINSLWKLMQAEGATLLFIILANVIGSLT